MPEEYERLSLTQRTKKQIKKLEKLEGRRRKEFDFLAVWLFKGTLFVPLQNTTMFIADNSLIVRTFVEWSEHIWFPPTGWYNTVRHDYYKNYRHEHVKLAGFEKGKQRPKFFIRTLWIQKH